MSAGVKTLRLGNVRRPSICNGVGIICIYLCLLFVILLEDLVNILLHLSIFLCRNQKHLHRNCRGLLYFPCGDSSCNNWNSKSKFLAIIEYYVKSHDNKSDNFTGTFFNIIQLHFVF